MEEVIGFWLGSGLVFLILGLAASFVVLCAIGGGSDSHLGE